MASWIDITDQLLSVYCRPVFGDAGTGYPGSTPVVVNPCRPYDLETPTLSNAYAVYHDTEEDGRPVYLFVGDQWETESSPTLFDIDGDPNHEATDYLGLKLATARPAFQVRVTYRMTSTVGAIDSPACSLFAHPAEPIGTISVPPVPMLQGAVGSMNCNTLESFVDTTASDQIVMYPQTDPLEDPVDMQVFFAHICTENEADNVHDRAVQWPTIVKVEIYADPIGTKWTDFVNCQEL